MIDKGSIENEASKTLGDHLHELRTALIYSVLAVVLSSLVCFYWAKPLMDFLKQPLLQVMLATGNTDPHQQVLKCLRPQEAFLISMKISLLFGVVIASPVVFYMLWGFIAPGLKKEERKLVLPAFACGVLCFLLGVLFLYFVVLKLCLAFFWNYSVQMGLEPGWTIEYYFSFVTMLSLAFGIVFEMPVVSAILAKLGILKSKILSGKRGLAIILIFIVAAILSPPDIVSQVLMAVPMMVLYEISIIIVKRIEKKV